MFLLWWGIDRRYWFVFSGRGCACEIRARQSEGLEDERRNYRFFGFTVSFSLAASIIIALPVWGLALSALTKDINDRFFEEKKIEENKCVASSFVMSFLRETMISTLDSFVQPELILKSFHRLIQSFTDEQNKLLSIHEPSKNKCYCRSTMFPYTSVNDKLKPIHRHSHEHVCVCVCVCVYLCMYT